MVLGVGCASVQYADVHRFVHDGQYDPSRNQLDGDERQTEDVPKGGRCWPSVVTICRTTGGRRKHRSAVSHSRARTATWWYIYLRLAYIEQLDTALTALDAGNDLQAVKSFDEALVFGRVIDARAWTR